MSSTGSNAAVARTARMERATSESSVLVEINLDGTGISDIDTSVPFYDHMLTALCKHSLIDLTVKATGDIHIDVHHTVEDVAITFGEVLRTALGNKAGIRRFGSAALDLAWVAAGRFDGFWEEDLQLWDVAAGILLVREAGGFVTDFRGADSALEKGQVLAANDQLHSRLHKLVARALRS